MTEVPTIKHYDDSELLTVLLKQMQSADYVLADSASPVDILFEGTRIHQLKRSQIQSMPDSTLAAMMQAGMKEEKQNMIELDDDDGLYRRHAVKMVFSSLTLESTIFHHGERCYEDLICCPLVVHYLGLPAVLAEESARCAADYQGEATDIAYIIRVLNEVRSILDTTPVDNNGTSTYTTAMMALRDNLVQKAASCIPTTSYDSPLRFTCQLSLNDLSDTIGKFTTHPHSAKGSTTNGRGHRHNQSREMVLFRLTLVLRWCDANYARTSTSSIIESPIWNACVTQLHPQCTNPLNEEEFKAVQAFYGWVRRDAFLERRPALVGKITETMRVVFRGGIGPEHALLLSLLPSGYDKDALNDVAGSTDLRQMLSLGRSRFKNPKCDKEVQR